jgi:hypothetical protein
MTPFMLRGRTMAGSIGGTTDRETAPGRTDARSNAPAVGRTDARSNAAAGGRTDAPIAAGGGGRPDALSIAARGGGRIDVARPSGGEGGRRVVRSINVELLFSSELMILVAPDVC